MKNQRIFTASITVNRGGRQMLALHKAGIFRFHSTERAICTCRALAVIAFASRLERVVIDSGKGKSLFCLPLNANHNHAHRNQTPERRQHRVGRTVFPPCQGGKSLATYCAEARKAVAKKGFVFAGNSCRKITVTHRFLVT